MKLNFALVFASAVFVSSCATKSYTEPKEPAPALWQGISGISLVPDSWMVEPGIHGMDSAFATADLKNRRTAVLKEDVTFNDISRMGYTSREKTLSAGTALYARQYTQSITTSYGNSPGYTRVQSANRNPIEWCAEAEGLTGWTCIFWQKPDVAFYSSSSKGFPQSPMIQNSGSHGPMPSIEETEDVTFKSKLKAGLVIKALRKDDVLIHFISGGQIDGEWIGNRISFQQKDWDENDQVNLKMAGGEFTLTAIRPEIDSKPTAVRVDVVKAPEMKAMKPLSNEEQLRLIELLMKMGAVKQQETP